MTVSIISSRLEGAMQLIKSFEGFKAKAYQCPVGKWTIGFGHTLGVQPGDELTMEGAEYYLVMDMHQLDAWVEKVYPNYFRLSEGRRAVLLSFVYNIGGNAFLKSTMLKYLKDGKVALAGKELLKWTKGDMDGDGDKEDIPGLVKRRKAEFAIWEAQK